MTTTTRLAIAAFAAVALAGCRTSVNSVDPANPAGKPNAEALAHTITDNSLNDACTPVFYNKGKTDAGFTLVQLQVQNKTRSVARMSYTVDWFDTNGMIVTSTAGKQWKPLALEAGKVETLLAVAPQPGAVDAKFHFIESNN